MNDIMLHFLIHTQRHEKNVVMDFVYMIKPYSSENVYDKISLNTK